MKKKVESHFQSPLFATRRSPLSSNTRKNTIDLISKQNFINVNLAVYLDIPTTGRFHPTKQSISNTKCFSSWPLSTFLIGPLNLLSLSAIVSDNKFASTLTTRTGRGNGRMQGRKKGRKEGRIDATGTRVRERLFVRYFSCSCARDIRGCGGPTVGQRAQLLAATRTHASHALPPIGEKFDRPQYGDRRTAKRLRASQRRFSRLLLPARVPMMRR